MTDTENATADAGPVRHTVDEALAKFELVEGAGDGEARACVMTALSWMAGESWSDHPKCAHPSLTTMAIRANDSDGASQADREAILKAGATGLMDTWWVPTVVVALAIAQAPADGTPVERCLATLDAISAWKLNKEVPNLVRANLVRANLYGANLVRANLDGANLVRANLYGANLYGANLVRANLDGANLVRANLVRANLDGAKGNVFTRLPKGWVVDEATLLVRRADEGPAE